MSVRSKPNREVEAPAEPERDGSELPEGWCRTSLDAIGTIYCGQSPATKDVNSVGVGTPYVTGPEQWDGHVIHANKWTTDPRRIVPDGCIFITVKGAGVGTLFPGEACAIGRDVYAFHPTSPISRDFTQYALQYTIDLVIRQATGLIPGLSRSHLLEHDIALPPLAEQRRIVGKLELLLGKVSSSQQRLSRVPGLLKRFRQSVLAAACSGKLTADWREENPDVDTEWLQVRADEVCEAVQSGSTPKADLFKTEKGVPFLKVYNIVNQAIAFEYRPQFVSEETHRTTLKRASALPGDVLMNIVGPPLGKVAIVPNDYPKWSINQAIALFRPRPQLDRHFLYYLLCSGVPYAEILSETRGSAGQSNISLSQCREMLLSVPPLSEQKEIVRRIEKLFALADQIESRLRLAAQHVDRLTQSLLAKAFRGELVPNEATLARRQSRPYEPASELLARIRGSQSVDSAKPKRRIKSR